MLLSDDYLMAIVELSERHGDKKLRPSLVARHLRVSLPVVTLKLLKLVDQRCVTKLDGAVSLTSEGNHRAMFALRRRRLIEALLSKVLGIPWDELNEEARLLEHAVSDVLVKEIDNYLRHPLHDPHGDPIPRRDGSIELVLGEALSNIPPGKSFVLVRVLDQEPEFLRFLTSKGLVMGAVGTIVENDAVSHALRIQVTHQAFVLGFTRASQLIGQVI